MHRKVSTGGFHWELCLVVWTKCPLLLRLGSDQVGVCLGELLQLLGGDLHYSVPVIRYLWVMFSCVSRNSLVHHVQLRLPILRFPFENWNAVKSGYNQTGSKCLKANRVHSQNRFIVQNIIMNYSWSLLWQKIVSFKLYPGWVVHWSDVFHIISSPFNKGGKSVD